MLGRMPDRERYLHQVLHARLPRACDVAVISGPPRVGKTTSCARHCGELPGSAGTTAVDQLDWDRLADRQLILLGGAAVARHLGLQQRAGRDNLVIFDNLPAYRRW